MKKIKLSVTGIKCGGCESKIDSEISALNGVDQVTASKEGFVEVTFDQDTVQQEIIEEKLIALGYTINKGLLHSVKGMFSK